VVLHIPGAAAPEPDGPAAARHGSAAAATGEELLSAAVDLPWDDWLGHGAADRVRDGSLGLVRHAYPASAARDMRAAATAAGMLHGDAADRERLGAVALAVAAAHARPARMPHAEGEEPSAWWVASDRALVWMPWLDSGAPYGLELLETGQADAVTVTAPDAIWTVYRTDLPRRGAKGRWDELPGRFREAVAARAGCALDVLERGGRWWRSGDAIVVRWREGERLRTASIAVNRPDATRSAARAARPRG
jgi:hypothetical protein